ncbi:MAG: 50S ribosomal protein L24 [SAR202 cluster bacterium]|nr:50S ribosomal protein L24 [SAR202 cluster bacterium]
MPSKIRRDDTVIVTAGKNKGTQGNVRRSIPDKNRVIVEGVNIIKRHLRNDPGLAQSGIVEQEAAIHVSNVQLICTECNEPTRVGFRSLEDGRKVRICKKCNETID